MVQQLQTFQSFPAPSYSRRKDASPWVSDDVLLGLSIWWVKVTHPSATDFGGEVALTFNGLQRDLQ